MTINNGNLSPQKSDSQFFSGTPQSPANGNYNQNNVPKSDNFSQKTRKTNNIQRKKVTKTENPQESTRASYIKSVIGEIMMLTGMFMLILASCALALPASGGIIAIAISCTAALIILVGAVLSEDAIFSMEKSYPILPLINCITYLHMQISLLREFYFYKKIDTF